MVMPSPFFLRRLMVIAGLGAMLAMGGCNSIHTFLSAHGLASTQPAAGAAKRSAAPAGGATASASSSATAPAQSAGAVAPVVIRLFQYQPQTLTIAPGTTVVWTNEDEIHHTVTSGTPDKPGGPLNGVLETQGSTYSYRFDIPGVYPYFCDYHNSMMGTIIVKKP
jgi:plastocyanin